MKAIPKLKGSYVALPRALTDLDAWHDLSVQGRLVLLTAATMLPESSVGPLATPLMATRSGLNRAQTRAALDELIGAGFLFAVPEGFACPALLDRLAGKQRGRVIGAVRGLSEDAQSVLSNRWRWVLGKRAPGYAQARARVCETKPNRTNRRADKPSGGRQTTSARATASALGGADPPRLPADRPGATDTDFPEAAATGPAVSGADSPGDRPNGATGEGAATDSPGLVELLRSQGLTPPGQRGEPTPDQVEAREKRREVLKKQLQLRAMQEREAAPEVVS